jgi:preprotein translocase subunit Sec61beta
MMLVKVKTPIGIPKANFSAAAPERRTSTFTNSIIAAGIFSFYAVTVKEVEIDPVWIVAWTVSILSIGRTHVADIAATKSKEARLSQCPPARAERFEVGPFDRMAIP